ncbi:MAG TPA: cytochrome c maturation protein CcmE [Devosia sp.]|uniref:cytochrome c maturation protein CcmE n=1 Tax=Devosia sp. TaxID=1871048 RepID=UPI002DDCF372|nr:cytochrome c maturation protein CcmE [Devosia sp.]HEV2517493.1 cytochrome c maturation protein CcmE [Devosia sp.]
MTLQKKRLGRKQRRLAVIAGLGAVLVIAGGFFAWALRGQITFFYSPSEIHEKAVAVGTPIRLGGLVKEGTWKRDGETSDFVVTDGQTEMATHYVGLLPDLFREGQGVVIEGSVTPAGTFAATNVLAKHDENYMPRELVDELKKRGEWQRDGAPL